jgi:hypothetical protein
VAFVAPECGEPLVTAEDLQRRVGLGRRRMASIGLDRVEHAPHICPGVGCPGVHGGRPRNNRHNGGTHPQGRVKEAAGAGAVRQEAARLVEKYPSCQFSKGE